MSALPAAALTFVALAALAYWWYVGPTKPTIPPHLTPTDVKPGRSLMPGDIIIVNGPSGPQPRRVEAVWDVSTYGKPTTVGVQWDDGVVSYVENDTLFRVSNETEKE